MNAGRYSFKEIQIAVVAVLAIAAETEPEFFPESMAYLALGSDMEKWNTTREVLIRGGFAIIAGNVIRLTDKGLAVGVQFMKPKTTVAS